MIHAEKSVEEKYMKYGASLVRDQSSFLGDDIDIVHTHRKLNRCEKFNFLVHAYLADIPAVLVKKNDIYHNKQEEEK